MRKLSLHRTNRFAHLLCALACVGMLSPAVRVSATQTHREPGLERASAPARTIRAEGEAADRLVGGYVRYVASALSGATIDVYSTSTGARITGATTVADGSYLVDIPSGTYTVTARATGYVVVDSPRRITVTTTSLFGINFAAQPLQYPVNGVVRVDGSGLSGVAITAVGSGSLVSTTTSQASGAFAFNLLSGTYTLNASMPGFTFDGPFTVAAPMTSTQGVTFTATRLFYTIGGVVISGGTPLSGVQLTCDGRNAVSGANGSYLLTGVRYGPCILAPTLNGYTFSPAFIPLTVTSSLIDQNFVATPIPVFTIGGRVIDSDSGEAIGGVQVTDGARTTFTDAGGFYVLSGVPGGNYTISAAKSGYSLSGATSVVVVNANVNGINFTARKNVSVYNASGMIKPFSAGIPSACVSGAQIAYGIGSSVSASDGSFTLAGLPPGAYAVTPVKAGCTYTPSTQIVTISNTDVTDIVFTEAAPPVNVYSIFGRTLSTSGAALPGVRVTYGASSVQSDAQGNFVIPNLQSGSYALNPARSGYRFEPVTTTVTVANANVLIVNLIGRETQSKMLLPIVALGAPVQICNVPGADCGLEPDNSVRAGAQLLPTRPGTYYAQIGSSSDSRDVYGFDLEAGVRYRFTVAHRAIGDINLYLYDERGSTPLVSVATPGTGNETLTFTPTTAGRYFVQVVAASVRVKSDYQFVVAY
jgi:hypothetical protein